MEIIAHRGGLEKYEENSYEAIEYAIKNGIENIEIDLRLDKKTGSFYLEHDLIHARKKKSRTFARLKGLAGKRVRLYCHLKWVLMKRSDYEERFLAMIREFGLENQIVAISFNPWMLRRLRELEFAGKIGLLINSKWFFSIVRLLVLGQVKADLLILPTWLASKSWVGRLRFFGDRLLVYVANRKRTWEWAIKHQIDGVITDKPVEMIRFLKG